MVAKFKIKTIKPPVFQDENRNIWHLDVCQLLKYKIEY